MTTHHIAWLETDQPGVSTLVVREVPDTYRPRHELTPVLALTADTHKLVFWNAARNGFQRVAGAEMI